MNINFDKSNPQLFGNVLKELRKEHGYSQTMVADYLGIDRTTYTKYELGRIPEISNIIKIASLYGISADSIVSIFSANENKSVSRFAELGSDDEESRLCILSKEECLVIDYYRKSLRKSEILDVIQNSYFGDEFDEETDD
ncbi:MAG: helix-turn-helix transcriptional regulator [Clostridia bacterium]|nr:helix-turn-helix transcriptional regulator [Clostridia bacterium]